MNILFLKVQSETLTVMHAHTNTTHTQKKNDKNEKF